jgi:hypothetical protein
MKWMSAGIKAFIGDRYATEKAGRI